jgi:hypothetical protein
MDLPPEAARQAGVFSYKQARASGISRRQLQRALQDGRIVELRHGVLSATGAPQAASPARRTDVVAAHRRDVVAARLSLGPGWYAARRSAALLMGLPLIGNPPTSPQLLRHGGRSSRGRDGSARIGPLPLGERCSYGGVAMTSPARTVVDVARESSLRDAVVLIDAALRRGVSKEELHAVLRGMTRWPGVVAARRAVDFADGRAESPGESLTRVACLLEGLPIPEPQVEIWRYDEFVARVDLVVKEALLVIESDGAVKFTDAGVLPALLARHEQIRDCGLEVLRTDWGQTFTNTGLFARRVRDRLVQAPSRQLAPGVRLVSTHVRLQTPSLALRRRTAA